MRKFKISGGARALCVLKVEKGDRVKDNIFIKAVNAQKAFGEMGPTMKDFGIRGVMELVGL